MSNKTKKQSVDREDNDVLSSVMGGIDSGEVTMKSKYYFIFLSTFLVLTTCLMVMALSVTLATIWNDIDVARTARVLEFGSPGRAFFLRNAPWILLVAASGMLATLYYLVSRFEISSKFRHSTPAMLLVGIVLSGLILSFSGINQKISDSALGRFKVLEKALEDNYVVGEIQEIRDDHIVIDSSEGQLKIYTPRQNQLRSKIPELYKEGQQVKVFGRYVGDDFEAYGIVPPNFEQRVKGIIKPGKDF